jgi:sugar/nucleoside kinase (ribokinase family)
LAGPSIGAGLRPTDSTRRQPTIVVVGAASRDLDPTDPRGWRLGGVVTYATMAIARLGVSVRALMGVDEEAASAPEIEVLRAAVAEVRLVPLPSGPVFDNVERPGGRVQVCHAVSDRLPLAALPAEWRSAEAAVLGPVAGELGEEWAAAFTETALVALAWQGLFRRLVAGKPVVPLPLAPGSLLARADLAIVSADDARAGGAPLDRLLRPGQQLVVTHGPRGALHLARSAGGWHMRYLPALPADAVRDPTGAGDALLGTWLATVVAARTRGHATEPWRALALAVAAASAKVETIGPAQMRDLRGLCDRLLRPPGAAPPSG